MGMFWVYTYQTHCLLRSDRASQHTPQWLGDLVHCNNESNTLYNYQPLPLKHIHMGCGVQRHACINGTTMSIHMHTHYPALVKGVKVAATRPFTVNLKICPYTKRDSQCKHTHHTCTCCACMYHICGECGDSTDLCLGKFLLSDFNDWRLCSCFLGSGSCSSTRGSCMETKSENKMSKYLAYSKALQFDT